LKDLAEESGRIIIVHLVVEEESVSASRHAMSRRLADGEQNDQGNQQYFGYTYYNSAGVLVTTYKDMFQIQYFNVVLWTALGLLFLLFYTIFLMVNMPLEPDTLLFGESAKLPEDD
jgi:hypothetical protein